MDNNIKIRLYEPKDRQAVRDISCDTADKGEPVESFFGDRRLIADLLTIYYTEYEAGSLWIAESENEAVGYLTGCLDTQKYEKIMSGRIALPAIIRSLLRGVLFNRKTWRLARAALVLWLKGGLKREINLKEYPAHLHINIRKGFRGKKIGHLLVEQFFKQLKENGVPGIHVSVSGNNVLSQKFFEGLGFVELERYPTIYCSAASLDIGYSVIYARKINQG